jgi:hypothetical protein
LNAPRRDFPADRFLLLRQPHRAEAAFAEFFEQLVTADESAFGFVGQRAFREHRSNFVGRVDFVGAASLG